MAISVKKIEGDDVVHNVSQRKQRRREAGKLQPPLTPMIDVTFQLLLFFLLSTTFREQEGLIPGSLPQIGLPDPIVSPDPVNIKVLPAGDANASAAFEVSGAQTRIAGPAELVAELERRKGIGGVKLPVLIAPMPEVRWEWVMEAYNAAVKCKFEKIAFASDQE